jgi:hypothetical protein
VALRRLGKSPRDRLKAGDAEDDRERHHASEPEHASAECAPGQLGVEKGEEPILEVRAFHDGQHGILPWSPAEIPRRLQEMLGVVGRGHSGQEHAVIRCALGFGTQAPHQPPGERMGPIESSRQMSEHLHGPVLTAHVGQLVEQERATPVLRPLRGARGQHDRGLPETMDDRNPHRVTHQKTHVAPQPQYAGRILDLGLPSRFDQLRGASHCPPREQRRSHNPHHPDGRAHDPRDGQPGKDRPRLATDGRGRQPLARPGHLVRGQGWRGVRSVTFRRVRRQRSGGGTSIPFLGAGTLGGSR